MLLTGAVTRLRAAGFAVGVLWVAVLWAALSQPKPPEPYRPPPPMPPVLQLIVKSGQPSPTGGTFDRFDVTAQPIVAPVNAAGQVAFYASVLRARATEGIFLSTAGKVKKVAAVGDPVPGGGTLSEFARHPLPALNDAGHVAFGASVTTARAGEGVFLAAGTTLTILALSGADAPGIIGGTFAEFDAPALNNDDEVVFVATVRRGRETLQTIYLWRSGRLRRLVGEGDPLPRNPNDAGARSGNFEKFGLPAISNKGVIVFPATVDHGAVLGGIFVTGTRDLRMLVGAGALAPNGEMMVRFSERVAIDEDDDVAFGAQLGVGRAGHEAVLRVNTTGLRTIAITGQAAPDGGTFSGFGPWPSAGPVGSIAFIASVENSPSPIGIFASRSDTLTRLIGVGDKLPDGGTLPPLAINSVTAAGPNGGVTFVTMGDSGEHRIYYFGPPAGK
jgi:hypothetical protein